MCSPGKDPKTIQCPSLWPTTDLSVKLHPEVSGGASPATCKLDTGDEAKLRQTARHRRPYCAVFFSVHHLDLWEGPGTWDQRLPLGHGTCRTREGAIGRLSLGCFFVPFKFPTLYTYFSIPKNKLLDFFKNFMYLFIFGCGTQAFSSCGEWGLLFAAVHGLLAPVVSHLLLRSTGSRVCEL